MQLLGRVHRNIRSLQKGVGVCSVLREQGDADARSDIDGDGLQADGCFERAEQLVRRRACCLGPAERRQQDRKLVASQARDRVAGAQGPRQSLADMGQQRSPLWWPRVSLTSLKRSRSMSMTAAAEPERAAASRAE
jgi:hypothetical protein